MLSCAEPLLGCRQKRLESFPSLVPIWSPLGARFGAQTKKARAHKALAWRFNGAGDGNRTRVRSLEGFSSTIEPHPHMVGTTGFEPATSCSQSRRATKLRHIPTLHSGIDYSRRIEIRRKDFAREQSLLSPPLLPFPVAPPFSSRLPRNHRPLTKLSGLIPLSTWLTKVSATTHVYTPHFFMSNIT